MKNYREQLQSLEDEITQEYKVLTEKRKEYNFVQKEIDDWEDQEGKEELQELLDNGDYLDMFEYDLFEFLPHLWYNNRHGEEKMGYILSVSQEVGIYILDEETDSDFFISFVDVSSTYNKIEILEGLTNF